MYSIDPFQFLTGGNIVTMALAAFVILLVLKGVRIVPQSENLRHRRTCHIAIDQQFRFVFALGAGDQAHLLAEAAETRPWLHALGACFGADKAAIGALASLTIHPGLAGLHVVETFATESPMVTADIDYHSHEIEYLTPDNSVMLAADADVDAFATAVASAFGDATELARLQAGCRVASETFTLDAMVDNFATGIGDAIATYGR